MPSVSCGCCVPSFLYRLYRATRRRAEASPRACVASPCARGDGIRIIHHYGTAIEVFAKLIPPSVGRARFSRRECFVAAHALAV
jgi:hypothetical protein